MAQPNRKSFLFLQTIASPFFLKLGRHLLEAGHDVTKINLNGGDWFFWHGLNEINFKGRPDTFSQYLEHLLRKTEITDIVLFGDCRPWHLTAIKQAQSMQISVWVFEEGYIRPHWITLEMDGVNANSPFDLNILQKSGATSPNGGIGHTPISGGLKQRIAYDFIYNFMNLLLKWKFRHHRTHRPYPVWKEYASWARRLGKLVAQRNQPAKRIDTFLSKDGLKYLFPLQLDSDFQVRIHSPFGSIPSALEFVITEFAKHAPVNSQLLIKNHPLDNGQIDYENHITQLCVKLGILERVFYVDGGDLNQMLAGVDGVVTINSTVGISALEAGCPVMLLGKAIYAIDGLVVEGEEKTFWKNPTPPDPELFIQFKTALLGHCHVNGNFYTHAGIKLAVQNSFSRMTSSSGLELAND